MDADNMDYHVFWSQDDTIGDRINMDDFVDPTFQYRKVTNGRHLQNLLKKYFGDAESVKKAIENKELKIVLGTEIAPVPTTTHAINGVPLEGQ